MVCRQSLSCLNAGVSPSSRRGEFNCLGFNILQDLKRRNLQASVSSILHALPSKTPCNFSTRIYSSSIVCSSPAPHAWTKVRRRLGSPFLVKKKVTVSEFEKWGRDSESAETGPPRVGGSLRWDPRRGRSAKRGLGYHVSWKRVRCRGVDVGKLLFASSRLSSLDPPGSSCRHQAHMANCLDSTGCPHVLAAYSNMPHRLTD